MKNLAVASALFFLTSVACSSSMARGGGMEGGGGVGVRCGTKLELLDLHEAKLRNLKLVQMPTTQQATIDLISKKMAQHFQWFTWENPETWYEFYEIALVQPIYEGREFLYTLRDLPSGDFEEVLAPVKYVTYLPLSPDIGTYQVQAGCHLEQIAYMTDGDQPRLEVVKSLWDQLDQLSKAALVAHETLYHFERFNNLESLLNLKVSHTSESARRFVGELFSTQPPPPLMTDVPDNTELIYCSAAIEHEDDPYTTFVVRENATGFKAVFEELHSTNDLYQILANFNGADFSKFTAIESEGSLKSTVTLNGNSAKTHLAVELIKQKGHEEFQFNLLKTVGGKEVKIGLTQDVYCGIVD